jgi:hypothetical protein
LLPRQRSDRAVICAVQHHGPALPGHVHNRSHSPEVALSGVGEEHLYQQRARHRPWHYQINTAA